MEMRLDLSTIIAAGAVIVSITGFVFGPVVMNSVQAEQILYLKEQVTEIKSAIPVIQLSLARIEVQLTEAEKEQTRFSKTQ